MDGLLGVANRDDETHWMLSSDEGTLARPFHIPKWARAVYILAGGGGGGGGGGFTGIAGTIRGGGGGGGPGSTVSALFPALLLPETIWFLLGAGGTGGTANVIGNPGSVTCVGVSPGLVAGDIRNLVQVTGGGGGNPGGSGTFGTGGLPGVPSFVSIGTFGVGFWNISTSNNTGGNGSASGKGVSAAFSTSFSECAILGGAGGSGGNASDVAGGDITGTNTGYEPLPATIPGGAAGSNGAAGIMSRRPFYSTGGSGGGFLHNATGGTGGPGAPGGGGGGGAAGTIGGAGGQGGDGFAFVMVV